VDPTLFRQALCDSQSRDPAKAFWMLMKCPLRMKRRRGENTPQKGDQVRFKVAHIFLPDVQEVLASLTETIEVEGTITDFSDSGKTLQAFAVVQLDEKQTVVVPVERLRVVIRSASKPRNTGRG
jgi:hypothetical protein